MTKRIGLALVAASIALSAAFFGSVGSAAAQPPTPLPAPPAPATSSSDDLADMVMDAIERDSPTPSTTAVPAPSG